MNFFSRRNQILLKELVKTDFKLRYQGSVIGYLWSVLKPILLFVIMYLVFVRFMRFGASTPHFAVAAFIRDYGLEVSLGKRQMLECYPLSVESIY